MEYRQIINVNAPTKIIPRKPRPPNSFKTHNVKRTILEIIMTIPSERTKEKNNHKTCVAKGIFLFMS
jgi:hypothetical protein